MIGQKKGFRAEQVVLDGDVRDVEIFGDKKEVGLCRAIQRVAEEESSCRRLNGPGLRRVNISVAELY